ncbi:MAG TPA: hypothetical protein VGR37_21330 [Longimicrobiaceae bacterium]|nr:hypothetical protein [Longimicrobiaceae bacterium]
MKKSALVLAAAASLALPAMASAQVNGSISASADIPTVLNFGTSSALSFGSITPGQAATGSGHIALSRNVGVIFTLPDAGNTGLLTRGGGTETLQPAFTCGVGSTTTAIVSAFSSCAPATASTGVLTLTAPATVQTEYVIFNGSLTAAQTNAIPGTYSGFIRITATAN